MRTNDEESGFNGEPELVNATAWPNLLRAGGYYTGVVGKWHINTPPRGYDRTAVLPGHGPYFDSPMIVDGVQTIARGHVDAAIGDQALRFLICRPHDRPFAMLYQFNAPPGSWQTEPRLATALADMSMPAPTAPYKDTTSEAHPEG